MSSPVYHISEFSNVWNSKYHLVFAQLSSLWKPPFQPKEYKVILMPLIYVGGMVTAACCLVVRVMAIAIDFLRLLGAIAITILAAVSGYSSPELYENLQKRLKILAFSFLQLAGGAIGTVAPPLGYAIDEQLHRDKDFDQDSLSAFLINLFHDFNGSAWCTTCATPDFNPPASEEKKGQ